MHPIHTERPLLAYMNWQDNFNQIQGNIHQKIDTACCFSNRGGLWSWIWRAGPESTPRGFCFFSDAGPKSKICGKPYSEWHFIFVSSRSLPGLYKCHCISTNTVDFQLHQLHQSLLEFDLESDSQIRKNFRPGSRCKNFGTGAVSENVRQTTSDFQVSSKFKSNWTIIMYMGMLSSRKI